jgi:hypothetical protein
MWALQIDNVLAPAVFVTLPSITPASAWPSFDSTHH